MRCAHARARRQCQWALQLHVLLLLAGHGLQKSHTVEGVPLGGGPARRRPSSRGAPGPEPCSGWQVSTLAGSGSKQLSQDGPALAASLSEPWGVALSGDGDTLFFAEFGGQRYRNNTRCDEAGFACSQPSETDPECNAGPPGRNATAFSGVNPCDCGCDLFYMHSAGHRVRKLSSLNDPAGGARVITVAGSGIRGFRDGKADQAQFNHPNGVHPWKASGDLLIADSLNHRVRLYTAATGMVSTAVGSGRRGFTDSSDPSVAELNYPTGLAARGTTVYIADRGNNCIRRWSQTVTTVAGDCKQGRWGLVDGLGASARFSGPSNLALLPTLEIEEADRAGRQETHDVLYVSDMANNAIRVLTIPVGGGQASVSTLLPALGGDRGLRMPSGLAVSDAKPPTLFVASYESGEIKQYVGLDGDRASALVSIGGSGAPGYADGCGSNASFHGVKGIAYHSKSKRLLASDFFNGRIRALAPKGAGIVMASPGRLPGRAPSPATVIAKTAKTTREVVPSAYNDDIRVMVWTGRSGPYHDHFSNGAILASALNRTSGFTTTLPCAVHETTACEEAFASSTLQTDTDVILIYADTYENPKRGSLSPAQWEGLFAFVAEGGGLFALHTASACWMDEVDCGLNATEQCTQSRKFHYDVLNCEFGGHSECESIAHMMPRSCKYAAMACFFFSSFTV